MRSYTGFVLRWGGRSLVAELSVSPSGSGNCSEVEGNNYSIFLLYLPLFVPEFQSP